MILNNISFNDQGNYTCSALTNDGINTIKSFQLIVAGKSVKIRIRLLKLLPYRFVEPEAPNFNKLTERKDTIVVQGSQPLNLDCQPNGVPTPTIRWFKVIIY